jgi:hypothetical protein
MTCPPTQWLYEPSPKKRTEARAAPSNVMIASIVTLSPRRKSEQRPVYRPHLSCPPPQWLFETTTTKLTEVIAAPSPVLPANTVDGCAHDNQANRGHISTLTWHDSHHSGSLGPRRQANRGQSCTLKLSARHHRGFLSPRRPSEQRPQKRPHLSCPPPMWLYETTYIKRTEARAAPSHIVPSTTVAG